MVHELTGPSLALEEGKSYRAKLRLSGAQCLGTANQIREKFEDLGFAQVEVFTSADDLPKDWPAEEREIAAPFMSCGRFAQGVWGKASDLLPRQEEIVKMWVWEKSPVKQQGAGTATWAKPILEVAWVEEMPDAPLDDTTRQALLTLAGFENYWGWPPLVPKAHGHNNWGNIDYTPPGPLSLWTGYYETGDVDEEGHGYTAKRRSYPSATDGARDLIRFLLHRKDGPAMLRALQSGDPVRIANVMKEKLHYFALSATEYGRRLGLRAVSVAHELGEPLLVRHRPAVWPWLIGIPTLAGAGYAGYRHRRKIYRAVGKLA